MSKCGPTSSRHIICSSLCTMIQWFGIAVSVVKYTAVTDKLKFPAALHKGLWSSGIVVVFILILDTRWKCEVRFTTRFLYPRLKFLQYSLNRKLTRNRSWSGPFRGRINLLLKPEGDAQFLCLPHYCLVTKQTKVY